MFGRCHTHAHIRTHAHNRQAVLDGLRLRADAAAEGLASEVRLREALRGFAGRMPVESYRYLDFDFPTS